jgi:transposase
MPRRHELTASDWARLAPLLPPRQPGCSRQDDRRIMNIVPERRPREAGHGPPGSTCPRGRGIRVTIPRKVNEQRSGPFDRRRYQLRHRVEKLFGHCQQRRSLWVIACTILWIKLSPLETDPSGGSTATRRVAQQAPPDQPHAGGRVRKDAHHSGRSPRSGARVRREREVR